MELLCSSMKIKTLIRTLVACGVIRALSKAKSIVVEILKKHEKSNYYRKKRKMLLGSFRMHYNWCSHVMPLPAPAPVVTSTADEYDESSPPSNLSGYLRWLEDKGNTENEIDQLADMFIALSHEKFRLEKVESHRRFQEMLARSV